MSDSKSDANCAIGKVTLDTSDPAEARNILLEALAALESEADEPDNIVPFPKADSTPEIAAPEAILSRAMEADLHTCIVIGANEDGGMYLSYASNDAPLIVFLLQLAMDTVITRVKDDHSE